MADNGTESDHEVEAAVDVVEAVEDEPMSTSDSELSGNNSDSDGSSDSESGDEDEAGQAQVEGEAPAPALQPLRQATITNNNGEEMEVFQLEYPPASESGPGAAAGGEGEGATGADGVPVDADAGTGTGGEGDTEGNGNGDEDGWWRRLLNQIAGWPLCADAGEGRREAAAGRRRNGTPGSGPGSSRPNPSGPGAGAGAAAAAAAAAGPDNGGDGDDPLSSITQESVSGLDDHIKWFKTSVILPIQNPQLREKFNKDPAKGVLFYGPPGTGKTLLARAFGDIMSKTLGDTVPFFHRKGGDLLSKWFGDSSKLIKELFEEAAEKSPSIIFLDELDGLCPSRDTRGTNAANHSIVTTLLGQMDTLAEGVFVIGATNRLDSVDPAMLRRFSETLQFNLPPPDTRKSIIKLYTQQWKPHSIPNDQLIEEIANGTAGFTGADLENLCREVFFTGFHRHIPNIDGDDAKGKFKTLRILGEDWHKGMENIKPSNSAVYGSKVYAPRVMQNAAMKSFLGGLQMDVLAKLGPLMTKIAQGPACGAPEVKTFYLWDDSQQDDGYTLNNDILPAALTHESMSQYQIFKLDQRRVLSVRRSSIGSLLAETVREAHNLRKPCIILIPNLGFVLKSIKGYENAFYQEIMTLQTKPVLVLATGEFPPEQMMDGQFRSLFAGKHKKVLKMRKTTDDEREAFFQSILNWPVFKGSGKVRGELRAELKKKARENTRASSIESVVALHDSMQIMVDDHLKERSTLSDKELGLLADDLRKLFRQFAKTRLRFACQ